MVVLVARAASASVLVAVPLVLRLCLPLSWPRLQPCLREDCGRRHPCAGQVAARWHGSTRVATAVWQHAVGRRHRNECALCIEEKQQHHFCGVFTEDFSFTVTHNIGRSPARQRKRASYTTRTRGTSPGLSFHRHGCDMRFVNQLLSRASGSAFRMTCVV